MDLAASAADAVVHFRSQKDHKTKELFWSQFHSPDRSRAAHCRSREEMAEMAVKLKDATDRNEALEKERLVVQEDLGKATAEAKDARSAMRAMKEELRQAGDIVAGKPLCCVAGLRIKSMLNSASCGVRRIHIWT